MREVAAAPRADRAPNTAQLLRQKAALMGGKGKSLSPRAPLVAQCSNSLLDFTPLPPLDHDFSGENAEDDKSEGRESEQSSENQRGEKEDTESKKEEGSEREELDEQDEKEKESEEERSKREGEESERKEEGSEKEEEEIGDDEKKQFDFLSG